MIILITGASSPAALSLARILCAHGHTLVAADAQHPLLAPARYSRAYTRYYSVPSLLYPSLAKLWAKVGEEVDLWIPFGEVSGDMRNVVEKVRLQEKEGAKRATRVIWDALFEKAEVFQDFVRERVLNEGDGGSIVRLPVSFDVAGPNHVWEILSRYSDKRFTLSPAPYENNRKGVLEDGRNGCSNSPPPFEDDEDTVVDDSLAEGSAELASADSSHSNVIMHASLADLETAKTIDVIPGLGTGPYRMTETITDGTTHSAHAFIAQDSVQIFIVTSPYVSSNPEDFIALSPSEALHTVMLAFTKEFTAAYGSWQAEEAEKEIGGLDTHLTINFNVKEEIAGGNLIQRITALSCSNSPHPSMILLASLKQNHMHLAQAYTALANQALSTILPDIIPNPRGLYSFPDIVAEGWATVKGLRLRKMEYWGGIANYIMMLFVWGLCFKEESWCWWDPGPAVVRWFIQPIVVRIRRMWQKWRRG